MGEPRWRDKKGYSFDAVTPRILAMRARVENRRIAFPGGSKYRVLVLPDLPTMTPETLAKIDELVQAGATVIGKPPVKSPSLVNHPAIRCRRRIDHAPMQPAHDPPSHAGALASENPANIAELW